MRTRCPSCGAENSLDALINHDAARESVVLALSLDPLGRRIVGYLALFRPAKRALAWERVAGLLGELLPWIQAAQISWEGQTYAVPRDEWAEGIQAIFDMRAKGKLELPLDSHNLLRSVLARRSRQSQQRAAAQAETDLDAQRRHNPEAARTRAYGDSSGVASGPSAALAAKRNHVQGLEHLHRLKPKAELATQLDAARAELAALELATTEGGSGDVVPD